MTTLVIELNDAGILVHGEQDDPRAAAEEASSPGYALLHQGTLLTGKEAAGQARLQPRRVNNRFWSQLDTSPLQPPFPTDASHADLAHAHLSRLWSRSGSRAREVILVVPGTYTEAQLGLALGIARACHIPVTGLVDAAVSAAARGYPGKQLLHLDLQLHAAVLTELSQEQVLQRHRVEVTQDTGLVPLHEVWVRQVAKIFVAATRFDPLHLAATEQELFSRLPSLLHDLCERQEVQVQMDSAGGAHSVVIKRNPMVEAVQRPYDTMESLVQQARRAGEPATLLLSRRTAGLPGLQQRLAALENIQVIELPARAAAAGALSRAGEIRSPEEALPFVTRLSLKGEAAAASGHGTTQD